MSEEREFRLPEPIPLEIEGNTFLFHFNNYALVELGRLLGRDPLHAHSSLLELAKEDVIQAFVYIIYAGVVGYQKREGNFNHGIPIALFSRYLAEADINRFAPIWDAFKASTDMSEFINSLPSDKKKAKRPSGVKS